MNIAKDIQADIESRLTRDNLEKVEEAALRQMDFVKNENTLRGTSPATGGRWNNVYSRKYANREKGGQLSPVTLRNKRKRIEQTKIKPGKKASELRFTDREGARIFFYHDTGTAKGGKTRQVYPANDNQVPSSVTAAAERKLSEVLGE